MMDTQSKEDHPKRTVQDTQGASYELKREMSRGGQGIVYHTHLPQVLIKGFTHTNEQARLRWQKHIVMVK